MTSSEKAGDGSRSFAARDFPMLLAAGPAFWGALYALRHPAVDLSWPVRSPIQFAVLAVVYPVLEEIVFRGWLQDELRQRVVGQRSLWRVSLANVATSAIFSLAHMFHHSLAWAAATFVPSLIFGYAKDRSRKLMPSIILHVFYNSGYFLIFGAAH